MKKALLITGLIIAFDASAISAGGHASGGHSSGGHATAAHAATAAHTTMAAEHSVAMPAKPIGTRPAAAPVSLPIIVPAHGVSTSTCRDKNGDRCK